MKGSTSFLEKLKMELPFDLAFAQMGLRTHKNPETPIQKNLCTPMFIVALFTIPSAGNSVSAH